MTHREEGQLMGKKQPVFVLGTARSGTSWCANLLAMHPDITAATTTEYEDITGIHESHLFSHTRYWFPETVTCTEFISRYKEEDYFKLTGLSPDTFCVHQHDRYTVFELFGIMMDDFADNQGTRCWLEKTPKHTIYYCELLKHFPDALLIVTRRNFKDTLLSNLNKYPRIRLSFPKQVIEKVFRYVSDRRAIKRLKRDGGERVIEVGYEDLLKDTQKEVRRLLRFLHLEERELHSIFPNNTAYGSSQKKKHGISTISWVAIYALRMIFWLVPFPIIHALRVRRDLRRARRFPKYTSIPTPEEWSMPQDGAVQAAMAGISHSPARSHATRQTPPSNRVSRDSDFDEGSLA